MYYIVYKTINKINSKFYIGVHKSSSLNDNYLGSGKLLKLAISKYGRENFERTNIFIFDNKVDMLSKEKEILSNCLNDELCYNLHEGGSGGFDYINQTGLNNGRKWWDSLSKEQQKIEISKRIRVGEQNGMYGVSRSGQDNPMYGKHHTDITKEKISIIHKGKAVFKNDMGEIFKLNCNDPKIIKENLKPLNKGKKHTEEFKLSKSLKAKELGLKPPSPKGLYWWNNGVTTIRSKECPGELFTRGRGKLK